MSLYQTSTLAIFRALGALELTIGIVSLYCPHFIDDKTEVNTKRIQLYVGIGRVGIYVLFCLVVVGQTSAALHGLQDLISLTRD